MKIKKVLFKDGEYSREEIASISYSHQTLVLSLRNGKEFTETYERGSNAELTYRHLRNFIDGKGKK
jgi:hypothetical protein